MRRPRLLSAFARALRGGETPCDPFEANLLFAEADAARLAHLLATPEGEGMDRLAARRREASMRAGAAALRMERLLGEALPALASAGVGCIVLKGYAVACRYWGDAGLRPSLDLDLLVRPRDAAAARDALAAKGFLPDRHHPEMLVGASGEIDLHTALLNDTRVPARAAAFPVLPGIFERSERIATRAGELPVLSIGDDLLYLAAHFYFHHGGAGIRWLLDIDRLLEAHPEACEAAERVAEGTTDPLRALRPLSFVLALRAAALGRHPPSVRISARAPLHRIERGAIRRLVEGDATPAARFLLSLVALPAPSRAAFLRQTLLPTPRVLGDVRTPLHRGQGFAGHLAGHLLEVAKGARWLTRAWRSGRISA